MGDIGSPTHPHSHVLSIKTWVLKTWEVEVFFRKREKGEKKGRGEESKSKETRESKWGGKGSEKKNEEKEVGSIR